MIVHVYSDYPGAGIADRYRVWEEHWDSESSSNQSSYVGRQYNTSVQTPSLLYWYSYTNHKECSE